MHIDIISVIPELMDSFLNHSIMKRAQEKGHLTVRTIPLRPYGLGVAKKIDDYQYGGEAGMVMMCEPLANCIEELQKDRVYDEIIYLCPDGKTYNQRMANALSLKENLLMICGHYKGVDERIREKYVTMEISIGDYVLSGGELAASVLVDSIGRIIPGVLNNETSALSDSHQDGLLSPPAYTRPEEWKGMKVPEILLSGHKLKIEEWNNDQAYERTKLRRTDLLND
jgi:tRNA (guanine37-N1)-methyltransferase